jgi:ABC-type Fe3+-siderophore transport system permease subunit
MNINMGSAISCLVVSTIIFFAGGLDLTLKVVFGIGVALLLMGAVLSGFLVSGDRMRANYHISSEEDNKNRTRWTDKLFITAVPFILTSILIFTLKH